MIFIGIDPGLDGAVAIDPEPPQHITVHDTPTAEVAHGKKTRRVYLPANMSALLSAEISSSEPIVIFIEDVHAMPGQGVRSMFSMGYGVGLWHGICAALDLQYELISPQRWKKAMMNGMGKEKDASRVVAQRMFPSYLAGKLSRKKDHGRADALLIAEYGRRTWNGGSDNV